MAKTGMKIGLTLTKPGSRPAMSDVELQKAARQIIPELENLQGAARAQRAMLWLLEIGARSGAFKESEGIRDAMAQGKIGVAMEQAVLFGFEAGRVFEKFGIDSAAGRKFLKRMAGARARRNPPGARHANWQARANVIWRENRDRKRGQVAKLVRAELLAEQQKTGEPERIPTTKTIQNIILKPPEKVSRSC